MRLFACSVGLLVSSLAFAACSEAPQGAAALLDDNRAAPAPDDVVARGTDDGTPPLPVTREAARSRAPNPVVAVA